MDPKFTRREFVKVAATSTLAAQGLGKSSLASAINVLGSGHTRRPNVIMIMLDDLGSIDANCYGSKDLVTPHMDALAASGVRFTQFYSAAPICSASRTAVLTGRYPQRAGLPDNADSLHGLPADEVTMAQMFKLAGYVTGHVGKWHLGVSGGQLPTERGFDQSFGHMGGCIDNYSHYMYWGGPNRHDLWKNKEEIWKDGENIGELTVKECIDFIETRKDMPFFLYWAINMPHYPLQGRAKWREYYKDLPAPRSMYAASVSTLDELIGQVTAKVRALGLEEHTVIALQSDHGHSTEIRSFGGGGNAGQYRGAKSSLFEGGIRIVSMLTGPGIPRAHVCDELVTGCDWLPTFAELAGAPLPERRIDGKSIMPVLRSPNAQTQHSIFHWQYQNQWAVRKNNWKLIGNPVDTSNKLPILESDKLFLSDLNQCVDEMKNLAGTYPEIVREMQALHDEWVEDVKDRS